MVLSGNNHQVHLSVSDCGKGFDPSSPEAQKGLGLVSMRERLRSVSGQMSIYSNTLGTRIDVWVNAITERQPASDDAPDAVQASPDSTRRPTLIVKEYKNSNRA